MASAWPVSSRDLRLERISGQPSLTVSRVGPPSGNSSWVTVSLHTMPIGPVHVIEPAAALQLGPELEAHVVLAREAGLSERIPERPRRGADVDDVNEFGSGRLVHLRCAQGRLALRPCAPARRARGGHG